VTNLALCQGAGCIAAWTVHTATFGLTYGCLCRKAFKATYPCAPDGLPGEYQNVQRVFADAVAGLVTV